MAPEPLTRNLPPKPKYLEPTPVPPIRVGDSIIVRAKERAQIIVRQNIAINAAKKWIDGVNQNYSVAPPTKNFFGF